MHLNYDCLRDVLIALEKLLEIRTDDSFEFSMLSIESLLQDCDIVGYSLADVFYCVYNLEQAGYIDASILRSGTLVHECVIFDITYSGHMFLRSIHDETVWSLLKKKFGPAFSASLPVLQQMAGQMMLSRMNPTA